MSYKEEVLKPLIAKSGNVCAYPGCNCKLIFEDNKSLGQIAHIEANSPGGPRYNEKMTKEQRNDYDNLIFLCCNHHREIDVHWEKYSVEDLKEMRKKHEESYSSKLFRFDINKIINVNNDLKMFIISAQSENNNRNYEYFELTKKTDVDKSFQKSIKDIKLRNKYISQSCYKINDFLTELDIEIRNRLKKIGINPSKWEKCSFGTPYWEQIAIGFANCFDDIKVDLLNCELLYYSLYLQYNDDPDDVVKKLLEKTKRELLRCIKNRFYYD